MSAKQSFNPDTSYSKPYFNCSGKKVLEYVSPTEIVLDFPFVMTKNKRLSINLPYLKIERKISGDDIEAIRLLNIEVCNDIVQLYVQELESKKTYSLEWNMEYFGSYWLWSLSDFDTIHHFSGERNTTH